MRLFQDMTVAMTLPMKLSKTQTFAAEEIIKYINKIFTKVNFTDKVDTADAVFIISEPQEGVFSGPEGFLYQIEGKKVIFSGSDDTGLLYAVYEFLERELGCCFAAFPLPNVPCGEVVPTQNEIEISNKQCCKSASDLPYRTAIVQFGEEAGDADHILAVPFIDYLAKNRYNRILTWISVYEKMVKLGFMEELEKRGIRLTVGHHQALMTFLPFAGNDKFPTAYAKEHPEYFRMTDEGIRQTSLERTHYGQWYLCSRNSDCIDEIAKNINAWLEANPVVDTLALWPNDGVADQCKCGKCAPYSKMENYLYFTNEVAKRLKAANPERKVDIIAYRDLWNCPDQVELCDNIVVDIATWTPDGLRCCGGADGNGVLKTDICKHLHDFHNAGSRTVLYEYYMGNYGNLQAVMPAADEMQNIFRYFKREGFDGSGTQMECFNLWNNILNFYAFARTAYDTQLSAEQNIRSMCKLFGAGAEEICQVLNEYEKVLQGQVPINETAAFFAENVNPDKVYDLFESALKKGETPLVRNNIRMMRMAFRYTMLLQDETEAAKKELGVMAVHFDSFNINNPGFGISVVTESRTQNLPDDKWYCFEA